MLSFITSDFFIHLLILNASLILCFIWFSHHYYQIVDKLEHMTVASRSLDEKQKRILIKFFPFYNKLSPNLKRLFEQKLIFFFFTKEYEGAEGLVIHDRMKLFISAYAAQVSLGFRGYGFSHIYKVKMYPHKFYSGSSLREVSWELDIDGTLHLSWKDFFDQLKKEVILPLGLEIMAFAIKKDKNEIKNEIFLTRTLLYQQPSPAEALMKGQRLFKDQDFRSSEDFMEACIKNYFSNPLELKNTCPDLFRKIDQLLYSQMRFTR